MRKNCWKTSPLGLSESPTRTGSAVKIKANGATNAQPTLLEVPSPRWGGGVVKAATAAARPISQLELDMGREVFFFGLKRKFRGKRTRWLEERHQKNVMSKTTADSQEAASVRRMTGGPCPELQPPGEPRGIAPRPVFYVLLAKPGT